MGVGTGYGALLAALAFVSIGQIPLGQRREEIFAWDLALHPLFFHFLLEGALAIGMAISIDQLLRLGRPGPPVVRLLLFILSASATFWGLLYAAWLARAMHPSESDRPLSLLRSLCEVLLPGLVILFFGLVLNVRRSLLGSFWLLADVAAVVGLGSPALGYLMGTAFTLLPGASELILAPLYGTMLGIVLCIFAHGRLLFNLDDPNYGLLSDKGVQKELALTGAQKTKAMQVTWKLQQESVEQMKEQPIDPSGEAGKEAMLELLNRSREETYQALADILSSDQMDRYKQLDLQKHGLVAFSFPDVQKTLKLSQEQKDRIKTIEDAFQRECQDRFKKMAERRLGSLRAIVTGSWFAEVARQQALSRELRDKVATEQLDDEQKAIWRALTGEPFKGWRKDIPWG
jgi:hypothetical protein